MFYEKQTATGILTATTSRSFRHFGDKESVVVTFASAADSFRGVSDADDKQHILRVLREAVGQSADSYNSLTLTAMERGDSSTKQLEITPLTTSYVVHVRPTEKP
ncbi:unnamed protein product [Notodromas monacha]|uniref:Uncharacterized protein n=1 Tax=Notodromas monacha TaxID=399045 RepID=A0A7R9BNF1_9CRUS|nr:unnamed protein product [Notodromas monacha]CAG0917889.1 unnamed protein product [Notodromas monacha]